MDTQIYINSLSLNAGKGYSVKSHDIPGAVKGTKNSVEIMSKAMMNPQEVKNFLYMVAGSGLQVDSGNIEMGKKINSLA